ncbi:thioredoxin domain-containing protein [Leucobacter sp. CSA2]|uniref:Thioredoxin domain-containing protein n=1 Tax=Leucobacter edaphi TaxID=2796472 RepID=A0A934QA07_9MICO|nr:thioredoxin domain-containing protein [Leucobacter edaphi]MBK0420899.1 thioredoxin domain-containing protein [Leucobacter edaphi]
MSLPPEALPRQALERRLRRSRVLNVLLGTVALAALVFGGLQWSENRDGGSNAASGGSQQTKEGQQADGGNSTNSGAPKLERRDANDPMAIGKVDAPVVLNEWVDMRCPFCAVASRDALPTVIKEYVDSGKVRIEYHDVAFFGEESARAAAAARAAGKQGKYHEFVTAVYAAAPETGHPELAQEELVAFAKTAGVSDIERFTADMTSPELRAEVAASTEQAQQLGVTSVPFFVADGKALSGAQPVDAFRSFLDAALDAA